MTRVLAATTLVLLALCGTAGAQSGRHLEPDFLRSIEDAQLHGTVTPPGADTRHATTEIAAYDGLVQAYPKLTDQQLRTRFFKQRLFGPIGDPERTYRPRAGVTVIRDARWGEPHIFGETDEDMAFGAGYVTAEDRLPLMELLRTLGRAEAFELIGTAPAWLADAEVARLYGYTEEEFQEQIDRLPRVYGPPGRDIVRIIDAYVAGVNEYVAQVQKGELPLPAGFAELGLKSPAFWKPTDVVAAVSTVRALFGAGGGSELRNATLLAELIEDYGPQQGRAFYDDFRNRQNLDGPLHTTRRFPYMERDAASLDPASTVFESFGASSRARSSRADELGRLAEEARIKTERLKLSTPLGAVDLSRPGGMSNHLVVGASRSATGHPILIGGPQAGYFSPQILLDYELHSPTIHARGAGFPGLSPIVVLGRTQNYAWTPTAGGSDMIDTYVERLCEPGGGAAGEDSDHYEFRGQCLAMDRRVLREAATLPGGGLLPEIVVERTVHGPVLARGTLGGRPVAITSKRSSYMKELDAAVSILKMNRNEAKTGDDFVDIFRESHNLSTNWSYANDEEIAYVHGGLYPRRPASVDPDLPVWGTGEWEWQTDSQGNDLFLGRAEVPHEVAPRRDFFVSWNNRPAPGWGGSDAQWGWSSVYRADLLEDAILAEKPGTIDPVRLVQMMEKAGLTDLRGRYVAPLALRVLESAAGLGPREQRMVELLREWISGGALRRDGDGNGDYDDSAAVAIMDAWWERLIRAVYDPVIGDASRFPTIFDNAPGLRRQRLPGRLLRLPVDGSLDGARRRGEEPHLPGLLRRVEGGRRHTRVVRPARARVAGRRRRRPGGRPGGRPGRLALGRRGRANQVPARRRAEHALGQPPDHPADRDVRGEHARLRAGERLPLGGCTATRPRPPNPPSARHDEPGDGRGPAPVRGAPDRPRPAREALCRQARELPLAAAAPRARLLRGRLPHPRPGRLDGRPARGRPPRPPRLPARAGAGAGRAVLRPMQSFALGRPVFGGAPRARALGISVRLTESRRAELVVRRGRRVVKRFRARTLAAGRTHRFRLSPRGLTAGKYRITLRAGGVTARLVARRL